MLLDWNPHKNSALKAERDISFDDIAGFIRQGIPYTVDSNTSSNHPDQKVIRMFIDEYAYYIPCVEIT